MDRLGMTVQQVRERGAISGGASAQEPSVASSFRHAGRC